MVHKIFLSYSHIDLITASGIARNLHRNGYNVWIDYEGLEIGADWSQDIEVAINQADTIIAILSVNSVRRHEVLREVKLALDKAKLGKSRLLFIVKGNIHYSWFSDCDSDVDEIVSHLKQYQYIQLDSRGYLNTSIVSELLKTLNKGANVVNTGRSSIFTENKDYIFDGGVPEKIYDNKSENFYYKVRSRDLSISTTFPFALDSQWLPDEIMETGAPLKDVFFREGFSSSEIMDYLASYKKENLFLSLIHSKQVILNKAAILNSPFLQNYYMKNSSCQKDKDAFSSLISNGSILIFLYSKDEMSPYIHKMPTYAVGADAVKDWNTFCTENSSYCLRESWDNSEDQHAVDMMKFCTNIAADKLKNNVIAANFNLNQNESEDFLRTLKLIEMQIYFKTRMTDINNQDEILGYSRSAFYKNYIVRADENGNDAVIHCLLDKKKKNSIQLKKMVDIFYNSMFVNYFNCWALFPRDVSPNSSYLNRMYLPHGTKEIRIDELKYAFSDFFDNKTIFNVIRNINTCINLCDWSLDDIVSLRKKFEWESYVELLESINSRARIWKMDFSELELLLERFSRCLDVNNEKFSEKAAYSFRVEFGSKVLDVVCTTKLRKMKCYNEIYSDTHQNTIIIKFQIGDITLEANEKNIFLPITIFDGKTEYDSGNDFYKELCVFLKDNCDFTWVN